MSVFAMGLLLSLCLPWIVFLGVAVAEGVPAATPIATRPLSWFILASQVRKDYDQEELRRLAESLKSIGQIQPVGARPDGTVLWGHRRLLAARMIGLASLQVIITNRAMSDSEIRLVQLTENMHRADLSGYEKWLACAELMSMNPAWQMKELAQHLSIDPSMATRLLSPSRCSQPWQEALREGKVGISDCYAASKLNTLEEMAALLALKLSGASRDAIEKAGRKSRNANAATPRLSRVKIAIKEATIVISGNDLGMFEVVELLSETLKEARKAADQFDVKTWVSMMRDKSKAG
jgi:ParB family transcriptional regulator, chromosome partitioning protein